MNVQCNIKLDQYFVKESDPAIIPGCCYLTCYNTIIGPVGRNGKIDGVNFDRSEIKWRLDLYRLIGKAFARICNNDILIVTQVSQRVELSNPEVFYYEVKFSCGATITLEEFFREYKDIKVINCMENVAFDIPDRKGKFVITTIGCRRALYNFDPSYQTDYTPIGGENSFTFMGYVIEVTQPTVTAYQ